MIGSFHERDVCTNPSIGPTDSGRTGGHLWADCPAHRPAQERPPDVPCHRVVNRFGGLCGAFLPCGKETHRMLLEMEGVGFEPDGTVDLDRFLWDGGEAEWKRAGPDAD